MKTFESSWKAPDGQAFFAQGWEPDSAPRGAVALVHGLGEHVGRYAPVAAALTTAGYAVLGFDQRGHGKTAGPRGYMPSLETTMDDIGRLLEKTARRYPDLPLFLYGHSMGGAFVLNYILRHRPTHLAGVISTSPGLNTTTPTPGWKKALAQTLSKIFPTMVLNNGLELAGISRDPAVIQAYKADSLVHPWISARLGTDLLESGEWAVAHAAEFPPIPLLLFHGTADRLTNPQTTAAFAAKVPGECTFKAWEGLYHETHNEPERDQVLATLIAWLDAHNPRST